MNTYYSSIKHYSWILLICTVIAVLAAFYLERSRVGMIEGSAIIFIDAGTLNSSVPSLAIPTNSTSKNVNYVALLTSRSVLEFVYQSDPQISKRGYTLDNLAANESVSLAAATSTITITVTSYKVDDAVLLANDLANGFASYIQKQYQDRLNTVRSDLQERLAIYKQQKHFAIVSALESQLSFLPLSMQSDVHVIQLATPTNVMHVTTTSLIIFAAAGTGILVGILLMLLMIFLDNRLRSEEQVKEKLGFAYLGNISHHKHITANHKQVAGTMKQELTNIWANLHLVGLLVNQRQTPSGAVLLVTSTQNAEGKTTVAAALAEVTVQGGSSVVVIDGNLHQPSTHLAFGMENAGPGLNGLLRGIRGGSVDTAVQRSSIPGVWLLPAGTPIDNSAFQLKRELPSILAQLRRKTDLIIIDAPSLLSNVEASLMATMADGVLFVVDSRHGKLPLLLRAKEILTSLPHKPTGVVLNRFSGRRRNHYYIATPNSTSVTTEPWTAAAEAKVNNKQAQEAMYKHYDASRDTSYSSHSLVDQGAVPQTFHANSSK